MEEQKTPETETTPEEKQENATNSSVEELVKNFNDKIESLKNDFDKRLADKDEIIKQLILQSNGNEEKLTDDEQSCKSIIEKINHRR